MNSATAWPNESSTSRRTGNFPWQISTNAATGTVTRKWYTRYVVAQIIIKALKDIAPKFPEMSKEIKDQLEEFRKLIESGSVGMIEEMQDMMLPSDK